MLESFDRALGLNAAAIVLIGLLAVAANLLPKNLIIRSLCVVALAIVVLSACFVMRGTWSSVEAGLSLPAHFRRSFEQGAFGFPVLALSLLLMSRIYDWVLAVGAGVVLALTSLPVIAVIDKIILASILDTEMGPPAYAIAARILILTSVALLAAALVSSRPRARIIASIAGGTTFVLLTGGHLVPRVVP